MTINDMLEQGIEFQGEVWVGGYAAEGTAEFEFFDGRDGFAGAENDSTDWMNREVKYMHARWDMLRIEIECEDLYEEE